MRTSLFWLLMLITVRVAAGTESASEFATEVTGRIEIAADGSVSSYKLDDKLNAVIKQAVDKNIQGWRFEPVTVDGHPVIAATTLRLHLKAIPVGRDDYRLQVANVWFGEPLRAHSMEAPAYPADAERQSVQGRVVLVLRLDESGNVTDVHPEQTSLNVSQGGKRGQRWRKLFETTSIEAAKNWKFTMTELVNGEPVGGSVRIPVDYLFQGSTWAQYIPGPVVPAPWAEDTPLAQAVANHQGNQTQPLDSRFRLKNEIIGTTL